MDGFRSILNKLLKSHFSGTAIATLPVTGTADLHLYEIDTGAVVPLNRKPEHGWQNMRHTTSKKIFTYWNNLRGDRPAPDRKEIEPSDIRDILGDTFILEVDKKYRSISFRLAGTRLCNAYGRELKGVGFLGLWDEMDNLAIFNAVKQVYDNGRPCTISMIAESTEKKFAAYEMVLLPLQNGGSDAMRILGTAAPSEPESWIGADPLINNRLKSIRHIEVTDAHTTPSLAPVYPVAQPHAAHQSSDGSEPKRVAHLTVFTGGISD